MSGKVEHLGGGFTWGDLLDKSSKLKVSDLVIPVGTNLDVIKSRFSMATFDKQIMLQGSHTKVFRDKLKFTDENGITKLVNGYDFIQFDCPPNLSETISAVFLSADVLVCPVLPDLFSLEGLDISIAELQRIKTEEYSHCTFPEIMIVLNAFDRRRKVNVDIL